MTKSGPWGMVRIYKGVMKKIMKKIIVYVLST